MKFAFTTCIVGAFCRNNRGAVAGMVALMIIPLIGAVGFAVDISNVLVAKQVLQGSADAAALAGAQEIALGGDPVAVAISYSGVSGGKNASPAVAATMASGYPQLKCFKSTSAPCLGAASANGLVVQEQASIPTYFVKVFGVAAIPISATSTAGAAGAKTAPLNVMLVLDTTASMNDPDPGCSIAKATKIQCAMAGVQQLLAALTPSVDQVGLMVFPGLQANQAQYDSDCASGTAPKIAAYSANPNYTITAPSSNFRASDSTTSLNSSSDLVKAAGGGSSNCSGMQAIGGVSTFFAEAIWDAQTSLVASDKSAMQNVIILLSDGDSNATTTALPSCPSKSTSWCSSAENKNECHAAIKAAQAAAATGTWVISIAYGASTGASCSTDKSPSITACATMQEIASDSAKFYSDGNGVKSGCTSSNNSLSELVSIFQTIGISLQEPRLLPDSTA